MSNGNFNSSSGLLKPNRSGTSSGKTAESSWDPFGELDRSAAASSSSSSSAPAAPSLAIMEKQIDDIKLALADIYTRLPLDKENQSFATSEGLLSDGISATAAFANTFVPLAGTVARGVVSGAKAVRARFTPRRTFEQEVESLKKLLNEAKVIGAGAKGSLSRSAYPVVLRFLDIEHPTLADVTKFRSDFALTRANIGSHWKDKILLKTGAFRRLENLEEEGGSSGGRKTRALRRNMRSKTIKSQRRR